LSNEPFTPGGLGATEAGIVLVLTGLGVSPDTAAAVAVLNRVVNYLSLAIVGPLLYLAPRLSQGIVRRGPAVSDGGLT
ncbi:MAG TPA: lysylphosphatidylglycerol synthase domain-containing protein, partial [Chloroflexota bacterium]|nr:lysylphosphatidylglycerol synthase domain-containing protein [Chloroflexota bacterium]